MKTLLLDSGIIPFDQSVHAVRRFTKKNKIIIIQHPHPRAWHPDVSRLDTYSYYDMETARMEWLSPDEAKKYDECLPAILNDLRTVMLAERIYGTTGWQSLFSHVQAVEKQIINSLRFLMSIKPDIFLLQATPHDIRQWSMAKTAEFLNIPILMFQSSPLPWRAWMVKGIDRQDVLCPDSIVSANPVEKKEINLKEQFIDTNSGIYIDALPSYEKARIDARGGRFWSWKKELKDINEHPSLLPGLYFKRKLYDSYKRAVSPLPSRDVTTVVFFMHYQPERTSMPEGGRYAQQWLIIRAIAMSIPNDWVLLVKEHPSSFMGEYHRAYRSPILYSEIASLDNVRLVPIEEDTFSLIDRSVAVATITGTVGMQALIRGKPVLIFGTAPYRGAFGAFPISNLQDVRDAFGDIQTLKSTIIGQKAREFLDYSMTISISGIYPEHLKTIEPIRFDFHDNNIRLASHARLLTNFLENIEAYG